MSAHDEKSASLAKLIRPLRTAAYEVDSMWRDFDAWINNLARDYGGLDLNPDFQRGHVWTSQQQQHFVENTLRGVISSSGFLLQFNCPNWDNDRYAGDLPRGLQCIDGLQRITAIQGFLAGTVKPFGLHVGDLENSTFSVRRHMYRFRVAIHNFERRADLLQHYLDLNAGGTPHSQAEIVRVRELQMAALDSEVSSDPASSGQRTQKIQGCLPGRER